MAHLLVVCAVCCALLFANHRIGGTSNEDASKNFWRQIFSPGRDTFVIPSDDGLVIMQSLVNRPLPLASYINGSYRKLHYRG